MAKTKTYRLLSGGHGRFEDGRPVTYRRGEEIDLNDEEAANLAGRVELIGAATKARVPPEPAPKPAPEPEAEPGDPNFAAVLEGSIPKVREYVATVSDRVELEALYDAESMGKNRSGALNVIGERLAELEGQG